MLENIKQKLQGKIAIHKATETIMIIRNVGIFKDEILCDCLVYVEEGKEIYYANATYSIKEMNVLENTIYEFIYYLELQQGKQLSLF